IASREETPWLTSMVSWSRCRTRKSQTTGSSRARPAKCGASTAPSPVECVGDDLPYGKLTCFPRAVKAKSTETVVFSWIVYPSRRARDAINKKVITDPRLKAMRDVSKMPFDGKRLIFGGFKTLVEL